MTETYPVTLTKDDTGGFVVTLDHAGGRFQGATYGESKETALTAAKEMIEAAIASAVSDGESIPKPEECGRGTHTVMVQP